MLQKQIIRWNSKSIRTLLHWWRSECVQDVLGRIVPGR